MRSQTLPKTLERGACIDETKQQLEETIKQKDALLERSEQNYNNMKECVKRAQAEMSRLDRMNQTYLDLITQYESSSPGRLATKLLEKEDDIEYLQNKLQLVESQFKETEEVLAKTKAELQTKEQELADVYQREATMKEKLGLDPDASDMKVEEKIQEMRVAGKMNQAEVRKLQRAVREEKKLRSNLEDTVRVTKREKETLEFDLRQQTTTMRSLQRQLGRSQGGNQPRQERLHAVNVKFSMDSPAKCISSRASRDTLDAEQTYRRRYCLICRTEFRKRSEDLCCRTHYRPCRNGVWNCCGNSHRTEGCISLSHISLDLAGNTVTLRDEEILKTWHL